MIVIRNIFLLYFLVPWMILSAQEDHPNLVMTSEYSNLIENTNNINSLFGRKLKVQKLLVDKAIANLPDVPFPKDPGGGYTHERHKKNYNLMYSAGMLYTITKNKKYADFIKRMLDKYSDLYPQLGKHPKAKKQVPGKLFWQTLNETVWLVHTIQAYDCIYDELTADEKKKYENTIFIPMCRYFLDKCTWKFDQLHNHGTWMTASVGMTGYVIGNEEFVKSALYGTKRNGTGGFLKQLETLFSPDGYYTEGPYYARYALWPFFIFAESVNNNQPELKIFEHRDSILKKAFYSLMQLTNSDGAFFPINDALKEKTWHAPEVIYIQNAVYKNYGREKNLLGITAEQKNVSFTPAGWIVSQDIKKLETTENFNWKSVEFSDGKAGDKGGLAIIRNKEKSLLFKYSSHGLSHGHFDKLAIAFYDKGNEILQDYGAARFLNTEQKFGGRYLPENKSYARQSIAHNTLVADQTSHYKGKLKISEKHNPVKVFSSLDNPYLQYISAVEKNAYEGIDLQRTLIMADLEKNGKTFIFDLFNFESEINHIYDLPFYYQGHLISTNFEYEAYTGNRKPFGEKNGYQHLWLEAKANTSKTAQITWLKNNRFYTVSSFNGNNTEVNFVRIGANDPDFNLRNEPGFIFRINSGSGVFVNVIEPHGEFNPTKEYTTGSHSSVKDISIISNNSNYTAVKIKTTSNEWVLALSKTDGSKETEHLIEFQNAKLKWRGPILIKKLK